MPRGRLPSATVAITWLLAESITVMSPETSLVTYRRYAVESAGEVVAGSARADDFSAVGFAQLVLNSTSSAIVAKPNDVFKTLFPLEREIGFGLGRRRNGHMLFLRSQFLVPRFYNVIAGRQIADLEGAVICGDGEVRIVNDSDKGVHPGMDVALHRDHDLWFNKFAQNGRIARPLTVVPFPVDLGEWMNVMRDRIRVNDTELLTHLQTD